MEMWRSNQGCNGWRYEDLIKVITDGNAEVDSRL
jgi:hypothetical protein